MAPSESKVPCSPRSPGKPGREATIATASSGHVLASLGPTHDNGLTCCSGFRSGSIRHLLRGPNAMRRPNSPSRRRGGPS